MQLPAEVAKDDPGVARVALRLDAVRVVAGIVASTEERNPFLDRRSGELEPTLSGRLLYPFADLFIVQWPEQLAAFPRAVLASGPLL